MDEKAKEQKISTEDPYSITPRGCKDEIAQRTDQIDDHGNIEKGLTCKRKVHEQAPPPKSYQS
jgi:hypothetical protein